MDHGLVERFARPQPNRRKARVVRRVGVNFRLNRDPDIHAGKYVYRRCVRKNFKSHNVAFKRHARRNSVVFGQNKAVVDIVSGRARYAVIQSRPHHVCDLSGGDIATVHWQILCAMHLQNMSRTPAP